MIGNRNLYLFFWWLGIILAPAFAFRQNQTPLLYFGVVYMGGLLLLHFMTDLQVWPEEKADSGRRLGTAGYLQTIIGFMGILMSLSYDLELKAAMPGFAYALMTSYVGWAASEKWQQNGHGGSSSGLPQGMAQMLQGLQALQASTFIQLNEEAGKLANHLLRMNAAAPEVSEFFEKVKQMNEQASQAGADLEKLGKFFKGSETLMKEMEKLLAVIATKQ